MVKKLRSFIQLPFGIIILSLLVIFVIFQFFLQGSIGIMSSNIKETFQIDAAHISILSSSFFYSYILLQIPAGIIIDSFGIKKCVVWAVLLLSLGCFCFALSSNFTVGVLSRIFMGLGSSFGFLCMLKSIKLYFEANKFPLIMSLTELFSTIGVAICNYLVSFMISFSSWQTAMILCGFIAMALAISLFLSFKYEVSEKCADTNNVSESSFRDKAIDLRLIVKNLKEITCKKYIWINGIFAGCLYSVVTVFIALWGVQYIKGLYKIDNTIATSIVSCIYLGIALSSPIIGVLVKFINITTLIRIGSFTTLFLFLNILYFPPSNYFYISLLMFLLGSFCSVYQLSFSLVSRYVDKHQQGTAMGLVNMLCMFSAPIVQPIIGIVLSSFQNGIFDGYEEYSTAQYRLALIIIPVIILLGIGLSLLIKEEGEV